MQSNITKQEIEEMEAYLYRLGSTASQNVKPVYANETQYFEGVFDPIPGMSGFLALVNLRQGIKLLQILRAQSNVQDVPKFNTTIFFPGKELFREDQRGAMYGYTPAPIVPEETHEFIELAEVCAPYLTPVVTYSEQVQLVCIKKKKQIVPYPDLEEVFDPLLTEESNVKEAIATYLYRASFTPGKLEQIRKRVRDLFDVYQCTTDLKSDILKSFPPLEEYKYYEHTKELSMQLSKLFKDKERCFHGVFTKYGPLPNEQQMIIAIDIMMVMNVFGYTDVIIDPGEDLLIYYLRRSGFLVIERDEDEDYSLDDNLRENNPTKYLSFVRNLGRRYRFSAEAGPYCNIIKKIPLDFMSYEKVTDVVGRTQVARLPTCDGASPYNIILGVEETFNGYNTFNYISLMQRHHDLIQYKYRSHLLKEHYLLKDSFKPLFCSGIAFNDTKVGEKVCDTKRFCLHWHPQDLPLFTKDNIITDFREWFRSLTNHDRTALLATACYIYDWHPKGFNKFRDRLTYAELQREMAHIMGIQELDYGDDNCHQSPG